MQTLVKDDVMARNNRRSAAALLPRAACHFCGGDGLLRSPVGRIFNALGIEAQFIAREVAAMSQSSLAKTANRSVVGVMNELSFLADGYRGYLETTDLLAVSIKLADTPCGPLKGVARCGR